MIPVIKLASPTCLPSVWLEMNKPMAKSAQGPAAALRRSQNFASAKGRAMPKTGTSAPATTDTINGFFASAKATSRTTRFVSGC